MAGLACGALGSPRVLLEKGGLCLAPLVLVDELAKDDERCEQDGQHRQQRDLGVLADGGRHERREPQPEHGVWPEAAQRQGVAGGVAIRPGQPGEAGLRGQHEHEVTRDEEEIGYGAGGIRSIGRLDRERPVGQEPHAYGVM